MSPHKSLTKTEKEVLYLLTQEFLSVKKIAIRRGVSARSVRYIIRALKEKGAIDARGNILPFFRCTPEGSGRFNQIRLHGQEFNIKLIYKDKRYKELQEKANILTIDGNTIRLYRDSIEVYGTKSFYGDTAHAVTAKAFMYWNRFFSRLEEELKIIIVKHRYQNIRLVQAHYAEINNELAKDMEYKADRIRIYTKEDGKLWFLIDNSFNLHEAEAVHPSTSLQDIEAVTEHFNDIRENRPPTLTQIMQILKESQEINKDTAAGVNTLVRIQADRNNIYKEAELKDYKPIGYG